MSHRLTSFVCRALTGLVVLTCLVGPLPARAAQYGFSALVLNPTPAAIGAAASWFYTPAIELRLGVGYTGEGWLDIDRSLRAIVFQPAVTARVPGLAFSPLGGLGVSIVHSRGYGRDAGISATDVAPVLILGLDWQMAFGLRLGLGAQVLLTDDLQQRFGYGLWSVFFSRALPYLELGFVF